MKRIGAVVLMGAIFAASSVAQARSHHGPLRACGVTLRVAGTVETRTLDCPIGRPFAHVYVGNSQLLNVSLSDHGNTITYYGYGIVARLHQSGQRFTLRLVSIDGARWVGVQLTRTCGDLC
jgi:hypothetical protein